MSEQIENQSEKTFMTETVKRILAEKAIASSKEIEDLTDRRDKLQESVAQIEALIRGEVAPFPVQVGMTSFHTEYDKYTWHTEVDESVAPQSLVTSDVVAALEYVIAEYAAYKWGTNKYRRDSNESISSKHRLIRSYADGEKAMYGPDGSGLKVHLEIQFQACEIKLPEEVMAQLFQIAARNYEATFQSVIEQRPVPEGFAVKEGQYEIWTREQIISTRDIAVSDQEG